MTSGRDYNGSTSWTEQAEAGTTISFQGSAVWAYGIVGGEAGHVLLYYGPAVLMTRTDVSSVSLGRLR
jgi:hypothetical protein